MLHPRLTLDSLGLAATKSRGQNFLVNSSRAENIVAIAAPGPNDLVVEIGAGLGALTRPLLETGAGVLAYEIDRGLLQYLRESLLPDYPDRLVVMDQDALTIDYREIAAGSERKLLVIGNLPYLISTPILFSLVENRTLIDRAVLMFQQELADRLMAGPGTKVYGRLSVMLGYYADISRAMNLGPADFFPRPKVGSTILKLTFKTNPEPKLESPVLFQRLVAAAFGQRRKTLRNALSAVFPQPHLDEALVKADIDPKRRAETLSVFEYALVANSWPKAT
ncbi:MAG: ribosomal RNA small subunit methyltransferase A [Deltaproteobacteria bacterium]|nr:ribosomal RNA small subunit methyltransferase A [Deltaproteobacteria bacterium]